MAEVAEHVRLPYVITAVLHAGPLPRLLQQLLDHASLQDICARHTLFAALFDLLKTMGAPLARPSGCSCCSVACSPFGRNVQVPTKKHQGKPLAWDLDCTHCME